LRNNGTRCIIASIRPRATIFTHSHEVLGAFKGAFRVRDPKLAKLFLEARQLIRAKQFRLRFRFILREDNRAVLVPDYRGEENHDGDEGDADFS
jgi:hypothetical protein